jgi:Predicted permeases
MILTTIWERYFLRETLKTFALFLFCFYGIYALIDYSNHASSFKHYHFTILDVLKFYAYEFVSRMDVLIPFAILIACVRTLCSLNTHNELVALMASGITMKRLLLPFVAVGLFFTGIVYIGTEVLQPMAAKYNTQLDHSRAKAKQKKHLPIQQLALEDNSSLIFQSYDTNSQYFFDTYWVRSVDDIYRIRKLYPYAEIPKGEVVERLQRNPQGNLVPTESHAEITFPTMRFNKEKLLNTVTTPDSQSLSTLKQQLPSHDEKLNEKEARLLTTYYYKWAIPWLCLLAVLAPAPFCVRFSRTLPVFFIYALSIFGLVSFYLVMDAAAVLGERQVASPLVAIWLPFTAFFTFFGYRFLRQ